MATAWIKTERGAVCVTLRDGETVEQYLARKAGSSNTGPAVIMRKGAAHTAHGLPDWCPGADNYDADGVPLISSQAEIDRIEKLNPQFKMTRDTL